LFLFFYKPRRYAQTVHSFAEREGSTAAARLWLPNIGLFLRHLAAHRPKHCGLSRGRLLAISRVLQMSDEAGRLADSAPESHATGGKRRPEGPDSAPEGPETHKKAKRKSTTSRRQREREGEEFS